MKGLVRRGLTLALALQALADDAHGLQTGTAPLASSRPRICLVLSGGGARGAAHVGVLQVLAALRVPVHCIAGTSMGAIVGASFASGMGTGEMLAEMAQITSERLFNDKPPRTDQSMRIKADDSLPLASPELGLNNGKLSLPQGVVSGVALEGELRRLVKVRDARSFDQLPIPFRAVATSLGDGQMVVFDRGLLATAMRASMAVPGLIAPLKVGDRLLIDGGLVRNLPIDVALQMGADVIIAVNLGTPLLRPDQIEGLQGVSMQTLAGDLGQDAHFNFYGQLRSTWLNSLGAEWRNDVVLGNDVALASRFYQPLSASQRWFVAPRLVYGDTPLRIYSGDVLAALYREHTLGAGLDLGLNFNHYGQLRLGVYRGNNVFKLSSGQLFLPRNLEAELGQVQASLRIDQLDSLSFAHSGYLLALNALVSRTWLGASQDYDRYDVDVRAAFSHGAHTLRLALRGGGSTDPDALPLHAMFRLGGFLDMSGFRLQQLPGTRFAYGRALYQARLSGLPLFEGVYAGLAYEMASMPQVVTVSNRSTFRSGTAYLAADTPLGVAYFGVGHASQGTTAVYLFLGQPF